MLGNVGGFGLGWPAGRRRRGRGTTSALAPFAPGGSMMQMDMYEQPDKFEVVMDMPGVQKEDVNISVDDQSNTLTVTTERKEQSDRDEFGWVTRERSWGKSVRSMALPNTADLQNAEVELRVSQYLDTFSILSIH
jgi:HSP20 family molecular chaperone IbpA